MQSIPNKSLYRKALCVVLSLFLLQAHGPCFSQPTDIPASELRLVDSLLKNFKASSWDDTLRQFNAFAEKNLDKNDGAVAEVGKRLKITPVRHCRNALLSEAWLLMSQALNTLGEKYEAEKYINKAIHCPVNVTTYFLLKATTHKAFIQLSLKRPHYALQLAEMVINSTDAPMSLKTRAYLARSQAMQDLQRFAESESTIEKALQLLQLDSTDHLTYVSVHIQAGLVDYYLGKLPQSLHHYLNAKRVAEKLKAPDLLFIIYNNIGTVMWQAADLKSAASFFEKAMQSYQQMKYPEQVDINMVYNNLGLIYDELGNSEEAQKLLVRSIEGYRQSKDSSSMHYPLNNLANIFLKKKQVEKGLKLTNLAIQILEREKQMAELIPVLHTQAQLLEKKKALAEADALIDRALALAENLGLEQEMIYLYEEKARIAELKGDFEKAFKYYKTFHESETRYRDYLTGVRVMQAKEASKADESIPQTTIQTQPRQSYGVSRVWAVVAIVTGLFLMSLIFLFNQWLLTLRWKAENQYINEEMKRVRKSLAEYMEKASAADRLTNHILNTMYHELRTPLNGINGFAELLIEECQDEKHRTMARTILQSGERLLNTLTGILDLSDTELLRLDIHNSDFNVHQVTERLVREKYRDKAEEKGLTFFYQPRATQLVLRSDPDLFTRILDLLVDNAIKYTHSGNITIELLEELRRDHPYTIIRVKDTGIGIPPEQQGQIFESFRQASEGNQRSYDGTGVGLSLAKNLVNILGGQISLESKPGEGSIFTLAFPALTEEEKMRDSIFRPFAQSPEKNYRILVVEDDDTNREFMVYNLQNLYHTDVALDGATALSLAKSFHYDAILLDISLGRGPSGIDVVKELRRSPKTRLIPVAAITANVRLYRADEMIEEGFTHYLAKPFTRSELQTLVATMIAS
ncbi:MAG: ATP-binding protein [Bacteroidales bacterium]